MVIETSCNLYHNIYWWLQFNVSHWISPLRPKLVYIIDKNSVRTTKKTQHFTVTKINRLTLFKEIIAVYCENRMKHVTTK
jgi:hypothetical protein